MIFVRSSKGLCSLYLDQVGQPMVLLLGHWSNSGSCSWCHSYKQWWLHYRRTATMCHHTFLYMNTAQIDQETSQTTPHTPIHKYQPSTRPVARTCEEDEVPKLCVLSLQLYQTVQIRSLPRWSITLVIRQKLNKVFLLVSRQQVQQIQGLSV